MKIFNNNIWFALLVLVSISCEDDGPDYRVGNIDNSILAEVDISTIELDDANPGNPAISLSWTDADYSIQTAINYAVELSSDEAFTNPVEVGNTSETSFSWTMSEFNSDVAAAGIAPFDFYPVYMRVVSSLGTLDSLEETSNPIMVMVKSYYNYPYKELYFVGPDSAAGWDNNKNNQTLFRSSSNQNLYTYTGYFNGNGELKLLESRGAWAPQYGEENGKLKYRPNEDADDPSPINDITSAGYYTFTANTQSLNFTIEPFDASGFTAASSIEITGSATTGSTDTSLSQYSTTTGIYDEHVWVNYNIHLVPGNVQFSVDGTAWGADTEYSGKATAGGGSVSVIVEDDYEVWFNDITGDFILIPLNL